MSTIICLIIIGLIVYKCGGYRWLMNNFRLADQEEIIEGAVADQGRIVNQAETIRAQININSQGIREDYYKPPKLPRKEMEWQAENIIGLRRGDPNSVKYMTDEMLMDIIESFREDMLAKNDRKKLELIARNYLTMRGVKTDTWTICREAKDSELLDIICEFY